MLQSFIKRRSNLGINVSTVIIVISAFPALLEMHWQKGQTKSYICGKSAQDTDTVQEDRLRDRWMNKNISLVDNVHDMHLSPVFSCTSSWDKNIIRYQPASSGAEIPLELFWRHVSVAMNAIFSWKVKEEKHPQTLHKWVHV